MTQTPLEAAKYAKKKCLGKLSKKSINTQRQKPISSYPRIYFKGKVQDFLGEIDVVKLEKIGAAIWGSGWSVRNCSKMPFSHELIYLFLFSPCPFLKAFLGPNTKIRFFLRGKKFTSWKGENPTVYEPLRRADAREKTLSNFTDS